MICRIFKQIPPHMVTVLSAWANKLMTAGIQLIVIRLLVESLGMDAYGVFSLLTGLLGWFLLADFGLGSSLQNHLSEARAVKNNNQEQLLLAGRLSALILLAATTTIILFAAPLAGDFLFKSFPLLRPDQKTQLILITGLLSCIFGISTIIYKIWYAQQRGYLANLLPTIASCIMLIGIWLAQYSESSNRLSYSLIAFLLPSSILPMLVLISQVFRSNWRNISIQPFKTLLKPVFRRAIAFWIFSLLATLTLQADYVIMSQHVDAKEIAKYAIITKILALFFFIYNSLLMALWPLVTELAATHQWSKIDKLVKKYLKWGILGMTILTVGLPWIMPYFFRILAPTEKIEASASLLILAGLYQIIRVWTDTFAMLLQSISNFKPFWILVPFQAITSIIFQLLLVTNYGINGIFAGLIISFLLTVSWGLPYFAYKSIRKGVVINGN